MPALVLHNTEKEKYLPETGDMEQRTFVQKILENDYLLPCMCVF
jgi:hypothetical protein